MPCKYDKKIQLKSVLFNEVIAKVSFFCWRHPRINKLNKRQLIFFKDLIIDCFWLVIKRPAPIFIIYLIVVDFLVRSFTAFYFSVLDVLDNYVLIRYLKLI